MNCNDMEEFIRKSYTMYQKMKDKGFSSNNLYFLLVKNDIDKNYHDYKKEFIKINNLFEKYRVNCDIKRNNNFLYINYDNFKSDSCNIRLYIPNFSKKFSENINKIFLYLKEKRINFKMKISPYLKKDGVLLMLDSVSDVKTIINYINSLLFDFSSTNYFLIKKDNIGISMDSKYSYNRVISKTLFDYIKKEEFVNTKNYLEGFNSYVFKLFKEENDEELKLIYHNIILATINNSSFDDIEFIFNRYNYLNNISKEKKGNKVNESNKKEKQAILFKACLANYSKYGKDHLLLSLLKTDPNFFLFTRDDGIRDMMIENISSFDIPLLIFSHLSDVGYEVSLRNQDDIEYLVTTYGDYIVSFVNKDSRCVRKK